MKKTTKKKNPAVPAAPVPDVAALIAGINGQLTILERKIDAIAARLPQSNPAVNAQPRPPFQPPQQPNRMTPPQQQNRMPIQQNIKRPERTLYQAVCADCAKGCEVPFKPSQDRPVYCKECFSKRRASGTFNSRADVKPPVLPVPQEKALITEKSGEKRKAAAKKKSAGKKRKK
ncbi:MAG: CxxC-x17-CxxC domain-containing protein [Candidatus Omnitrophota bacterium]